MRSLTGQLLIAMPQMDDPFFARSVVYLCAHDRESGAMGLIVNKTIDGAKRLLRLLRRHDARKRDAATSNAKRARLELRLRRNRP